MRAGCTPLYREANALTGGVSLVLGGSGGSVTNALTPLFLSLLQSVPHNAIGTSETVSGRESASGFTRGLPAPQTPARYVSLDNLIRLNVAPRVLNAAARIRDHICSNVIDAQQFYRRSLVRELVDDELCDPIV